LIHERVGDQMAAVDSDGGVVAQVVVVLGLVTIAHANVGAAYAREIALEGR